MEIQQPDSTPASRNFDSIIKTYLPRACGRHLLIVMTLIPVICQPFPMYGQLAFLTPDHHCHQPAVNATAWTDNDTMQLAIPYKSDPQLPPRIGQPFEPCLEYDVDRVWGRIDNATSLVKALSIRDRLYPNLTTRKCSRGYHFVASSVKLRRSLSEDFETVCDREHLVSLTNSAYMVGMQLGFLIGGPIADNRGRRPTLLMFSFFGYVFAIVAGFSVNLWMFMALRLIMGMCIGVVNVVGFVLLAELFSDTSRNFNSVLGKTYLSLVARTSVVAIFYFTQDWRWAHIALSYPLLLLLPGYFIWTESPRWLLRHGRATEAYEAMLAFLSHSGRHLTDDEKTELREEMDGLAQQQTDRERRENSRLHNSQEMVDLVGPEGEAEDQRSSGASANCCVREVGRLRRMFSHPKIRRPLLLSTFIFLIQTFIFYGVSFYSVRLKGNPYVIAAVLGLIGVPGSLLQYLLFRFFDRKWPMVALYTVCGVALGTALVFVVLENRGLPVIVASTVGYVCMDTLTGMMYTRLPELFPSTHRTTAVGFASCMARFGPIAGFYVERLDEMVWPPLPLLLFTTGAVLAAIACAFTPSGRGEMPEAHE